MVSNKITEGVGKKIVEALKMQSDIEVQNVIDNSEVETHSDLNESSEIEFINKDNQEYNNSMYNEPLENSFETNDQFNSINNFQHTQNQSFDQPITSGMINFVNNDVEKESINNDVDGFEIPANVAVLKQLINQLPAGVSKQTGAQIIRQTMEALGISMKNVLQEAQQVQEGLSNSARECQTTIMDYKRQIGVLEKQALKYQKQYGVLNDIISLFIQTNN